LRTPGELGITLAAELFDQNVKVSKQAHTKGETYQDGGENVFVVVVHALPLTKAKYK